MRLKPRIVFCLFALLAAASLRAQQVSLFGLRAVNHVGAFHGLKADSAGNLYTLFDAHDGVRLLKFSADGTQLLQQVQIGQAGDTGVALDIDGAGFIAIAGTSTSLGNASGTAGTAFPDRSDTTTNSFVARFTPALTLQWLSFVGSGRTAVMDVAATASAVYITGGIFAATLPVSSNSVQQSPAPGSSGNGFVEAFNASTGTLQYATYLTGANGDTQPAAIVADSEGNAYIAGTTTATGYPTTAALVPDLRSADSSGVSGFVTKLDPAGGRFVFSTFIPGDGLTSIALDTSSGGSLLMSGNLSPGLFPLTNAQSLIAKNLSYQSVLRMPLDGSSVLSSTLLGPASTSLIAAGSSNDAWVFTSSQSVSPLLPLPPLENMGNAAAFHVGEDGKVDRDARIGGLPVNNSAFASLPITAGGVAVQNGGAALAGSIAPTLSSELLPTQHFDLPLTQSPNSALPESVRDALPLPACSGSACAGSAGLLARLAPDAAAPQLALSSDDHPNLILRNLGTADANGIQITANNDVIASGCGSTLPAGAECSIALTGTAVGSVTVQASNFPAFTTQLPATTRTPNAVTVTPHALDFGIVTSASSSATRTLVVRNLGNTSQTFPSQRIDAIPSAYTLAEASSTCVLSGDGVNESVPANGTCVITIALTPSADNSNDGPANAIWQVGGYDIPVTGYAQAAATSLSDTTIDFGRQFVNGLRSPRYLYLSNASDTAQAHASAVSTDQVFTVVDECPSILQPRSICRIGLTYFAANAPSSDALSLVVDGATVTVLGETLPPPSTSGAGANPNLALSTTAILFADPVTVTAVSGGAQTVTLSNSGAAPFPLQLAITGDFIESTDCPASLPGGASCNVSITFAPSAPGARQGLLSVAAGSADPAYVTLSGTGSTILPQENGIAFGDVPLDTPSVQWLKIQQALVSATATTSDPSYRVVLIEDTGFGHGEPPPSAFTATATGSCLNCWLGIQFLPASTGADLASISLHSSMAGKPTSLAVSGNGVPLTGLILTPVSQDFGPVAVHSSSASTIFELTNATGTAIASSASATTGDFSVTKEPTGGASCTASTLPPGGSCFIPVRFTPSAVGTRTGQLTVQTAAGSAAATLSGTGSDDPGISFTPGEVRFDNVPGSASSEQSITLTNTGQIPETIGTPASSDAHFTASSACSTLAPGASCSITVAYTAQDSLSSGTLTIPVTSAPAGTATTTNDTIALSGLYTSESEGLQIVPGEHTTVNFGAKSTGSISDARILHVNNLSGKSLTISIAAPLQFAVTTSTCGQLAAGGSCDLAVQFTPLTAGDTTGTVLLQGIPADGSAMVNGLGYMEGYGEGNGVLSVSGNLSILGVLGFGQIDSGQSASQTLTLTNPVDAPAGTAITVRRIRSEAPFLSTTTCGQPLAPGQSCTVTVTYAPVFQVVSGTDLTAPRIDTASITIESDASNAPQFVDLSGQAAPVTVTTPASGEPLLAFSTSQGSLTFANTAVGSSSAAQTVQLSNTGNAAVHMFQLIASPGFSATTTDCTVLLPGGVCTVAVSYQPQIAGVTLGSLEIQSDSAASLEVVSLEGTASAASVALAPQSIDFGRVLVGRATAQSVTLTNTGTVPVTMGSVTISGAAFTLGIPSTTANPCPAAGNMLPAGATCSIAVDFTPASAGTLRGSLSVATSATPLPLSVALSGVGAQPQLTVTPAALSFGSVFLGSASTLSLTLRNISGLPVDGLAFTATQDFAVGSTCGLTTLNAGSSCSVSVTFAPSGTGDRSGTLTIRSTDPASPIAVPLSGTGMPNSSSGTSGSFVLTVNGLQSASASVVQGIAASYSLSVTPKDGYTGAVALTCTPDSPASYTACSLLPPSLTLSTGSQASTATITTVTGVATAQRRTGDRRGTLLTCMVPAGLLFLLLRRRKTAGAMLFCLVAFALNGCGGRGPDPRIRYASAGTYTFHVTATSTNSIPVSQTVTLTLVVTPKD